MGQGYSLYLIAVLEAMTRYRRPVGLRVRGRPVDDRVNKPEGYVSHGDSCGQPGAIFKVIDHSEMAALPDHPRWFLIDKSKMGKKTKFRQENIRPEPPFYPDGGKGGKPS